MEDRTPEPDGADEPEDQAETDFDRGPTVHYSNRGPEEERFVTINLNNRTRFRDEMILRSHRALEELFTETLDLEP